jgi:murein DD-endopeptidase MepM/ murein hydrolase activator NlpD
MREKRRHLIGALAILSATALCAIEVVPDARAFTVHDPPGNIEQIGAIAFPFDDALKYPFTKRDSQKCGRWGTKSQDFPYFGAPRDGDSRKHGGIDLYPAEGEGVPIKAIQDGTVIKISPFYKRRNGEMTYAVLIDHKEYVANYAELREPVLEAGAVVRMNQTIGFVSGTKHLHFDLYTAGTRGWMSWSWYGAMPSNLIDPTDMMTRAARERYPSRDFTPRSSHPAMDMRPTIR